jgi:hypothetical protein
MIQKELELPFDNGGGLREAQKDSEDQARQEKLLKMAIMCEDRANGLKKRIQHKERTIEQHMKMIEDLQLRDGELHDSEHHNHKDLHLGEQYESLLQQLKAAQIELVQSRKEADTMLYGM